jgi:inorganic pyrophosphatase
MIDISRSDEDTQDVFDVVIEIPKGSNIKYEMDIETGILLVDRKLSVTMTYPCNYGFVSKTREKDGDHVDVFVLGNYPIVPTSIIRSRVIGVLLTEDQNGKDSKIIAVPVASIDPSFSTIDDVEAIPYVTRTELEHFVKHHKDLERDKYVKVLGWKDKEVASSIIFEAQERYRS